MGDVALAHIGWASGNFGCISSGRKGGETARRCLEGAVGQVSLGDTTK